MLAADLLVAGDVSLGQTDGATGSISGSVYASASAASCDAHAAAASLADVRVQLLNTNGAVIEERSTGESGDYHFADLLPGEYAVRQIARTGLLKGASHVGDGGGIAFDSNLVGEIVVQAGETLGGYDFCEFESTVEPAGPTDRPIVPHDIAVQVLPFLTLPLPSASAAVPEILAEPAVESASDTVPALRSPLEVSRRAEVHGGSNRSSEGPEEIKTWDDDPFDSLFSTAGSLELASAEWPTVETFEPIISEPGLRATNESGDVPFAEGYTANTLEWWEVDAHSELAELMGDAEIIDLDVAAAVLEIARLGNVR